MTNGLAAYLPSFLRDRLEGHSSLKRILSNTGWLFFDKILRMGVGLLVGVWVARYLGPVGFGSLNFAAAFVAMFGPLATLGLDGIVVREIIVDPDRKYEILASAFVLKLCGGVVGFLVSLIAISFMRAGDVQARLFVGIFAAGLIFQALDTLDLWFQSGVQSKYTVIAKNAAFIIVAMAKVFLILAHAPLSAFIWAYLAEIVLASCGLVLVYRYTQQHFSCWEFNSVVARQLFSKGWPLLFSGLAIMVYMKIDQVMLGSMIGDKSVGIYSAATRVSELCYFIPVSIVSSLTPAIMQLKQGDPNVYCKKLQNCFDLMAVLAYAVAIPVSFLSSRIINFLYTSSYGEASNILTVHVWASIFVFLGVTRNLWVLAEGCTKVVLFSTTVGALLNIVLNLFLIPKYGAMGAAVATLGSYGFSDFFIFLLFPGLRKVGIQMTKAVFLHFLWCRPVNAE